MQKQLLVSTQGIPAGSCGSRCGADREDQLSLYFLSLVLLLGFTKGSQKEMLITGTNSASQT